MPTACEQFDVGIIFISLIVVVVWETQRMSMIKFLFALRNACGGDFISKGTSASAAN